MTFTFTPFNKGIPLCCMVFFLNLPIYGPPSIIDFIIPVVLLLFIIMAWCQYFGWA